jgi:flagellar basal body-associated protein FliL
MTLHLNIDNNIPAPPKDDLKSQDDLLRSIRAATNAAKLLFEHGLLTPELTEKDLVESGTIVTSYAADPETTSKTSTPVRMGKMTPAALQFTADLLEKFGHRVVEDAVQVRHLVMNKLLIETDNEDARIRLRALELLGKMTDVGLFTERSEVTVTHQTTDELRERLKTKLMELKDVTPKGE